MAKYGQPVISRETRLLLITIIAAVAALWLLARLRFQDRPATAAPVPPVLAQLRPTSSYDDLARSLSTLRPSVAATMATTSTGASALRIDAESAVRLNGTLLERVRVPAGTAPILAAWRPRILDYPRYLVAADLFDGSVSLRPVFLGSMVNVESPVWRSMIWQLPAEATLSAGTWVFTLEGQLAGLAVVHDGAPALLPGALVLAASPQLPLDAARQPVSFGLDLQPTPVGLAVVKVSSDGPAAERLVETDIVEAIDGRPVTTLERWNAYVARINSGETVTLRVRRGSEVHDVALVASDVARSPETNVLGLRLRARPTGVEVLSVEAGSRAARAGIIDGDVVTVIAGQKVGSPVQVTQAFDELAEGGRLLVALSRQGDPRVVLLEK